jgi:hypothetical protein
MNEVMRAPTVAVPVGLARDGVTKTILLLLILLGLVLPSGTARVEVARGRWTKQAPIPTWFSLQGIATLSATECWIASAPLLGRRGRARTHHRRRTNLDSCRNATPG